MLYVCNVEEASADKGNEFSEKVKVRAAEEDAVAVVVSAQIESEIAVMPAAEQKDYLDAVGLDEPGLNRVIRAGYGLLHLITYFTVGPKEARAWTVEKGTKAPAAAGVIHSDFEKGFIRSETIAYDDYVAFNGEVGRARGRQIPAGRQGICRFRRRRDAFPVCELIGARPPYGFIEQALMPFILRARAERWRRENRERPSRARHFSFPPDRRASNRTSAFPRPVRAATAATPR